VAAIPSAAKTAAKWIWPMLMATMKLDHSNNRKDRQVAQLGSIFLRFKRFTLAWVPCHRPQSSSASRLTAGAAGFLHFTQ
jgi:hypothetical protein